MKTSQCPTDIWFDEDEAWNMMECLIKMLREFSMRNLVHGDIQPSNIFVYEENH